jgi:hypothetical protein
MAVEIPHLALPLRVAAGAFAVVEQDSNEEIAQCVEVICRYRQGQRSEAPEFGLPELAFREVPVGAFEINREIARQEPRAAASVEEDPTYYADAVSVLGIRVEGGEGGD